MVAIRRGLVGMTLAGLAAMAVVSLTMASTDEDPVNGRSASGATSAPPAAEPPAAESLTAVPLTGDFDGDGRDDVFWYGPGDDPDHHWYGRANRVFGGKAVAVDGTYEPFVGDFDGDGRDDVFWYGAGDVGDSVWYGGPDHGFAGMNVSVDGTLEPFVGDFDGDGRDDVFWYGAGDVGDSVWYGAAGRGFGARAVRADGSSEPFVGDFDGDGRDDVFWYGAGDVGDSVWYGGPDHGFAGMNVSVDGTLEPFVGDFDGDGRDDVFWYGAGDAGDSVWYGAPDRSPHAENVVVRGMDQPNTGDFDGDGRTDIFWHAAGPSHDRIWFSESGGARFAQRPTTIDLAHERPDPLQPEKLVEAFAPFGYVAHGAGIYEGRGYTNSLDAFRHNYARGFRVFEIDFVMLADGTVLAAHSGLEESYGLDKPFQQATWGDLQGHRYGGKFTIMRSQDVIELLREHPDAYVILDTKDRHDEIFRTFVWQTGGDPALMDRIFPHVRDQDELDTYREVWPLRNFVVALYRTQFKGEFDDDEVIEFVRNNRAPAVMMWWKERDPSLTLRQNHFKGRRFTPRFAEQLRAAGAVPMVHSLGDREAIARFESLGVAVYSDGPWDVTRGEEASAPAVAAP